MTCIVGLVDKEKVYIGGDSAASSSLDMRIRTDEKVFHNGPFIMGFTSSFRMGQLLRYAFEPPTHPFNDDGLLKDTYQFMVTDFINAVRQCLKDGGYAKEDKGQEFSGSFLVGYKGRLFMVDDDYQVAESADCFDAVGSGEFFALGSLYSSQDLPPVERIKLALKAAERYGRGVRAPFNLVDN